MNEIDLDQTFPREILAGLKRALDEDIGSGDVTTNSIVPADAMLRGQIVEKQAGIVAGLDVAEKVLLLLDDQINFVANAAEGSYAANGSVLAGVSGSARALLTGER